MTFINLTITRHKTHSTLVTGVILTLRTTIK